MAVIPGALAGTSFDGRPDVDLVSGELYASDVHDALRWMRQFESVYHDRTNDLWAVTRHADIMAISKNSAAFRSGQGFRPDSPAMPMMISMDRPEHMTRRNLVNRGFTPRRVAAFEPRVREICTQILDAIAEKGECDFVRDVASWLPLIVIGDLLGVDAADHDKLLRWSDDLMNALGSTEPAKLEAQARAALEYREYNQRVVADRRSRPEADDLMSTLVHAKVDGESLDDESLYMESLLILIGGDETTRHVISGGMHQLMLNLDQYRALRDDPRKVRGAVEEMLRWVTPIQNMMRTVEKETEVGNHVFSKGDRLLLMYASANRDEALFEDPYRFDIDRDPNPHVAFGGYGAHFCLGNSLARLELRVMFEEIVRRIPDMGLASAEPPPLRPANFVVGIESLPVRFTPVGRAS